MKIEKTIRSQARKALDGNFTGAVAALIILFGFIFFVFLLFCSTANVLDVFDDNDQIKSGRLAQLIVSICLSTAAGLLLTPIKNGFLKFFYNLTTTGENNLRDVFYFFSGIKRYLKALLFNLLILVKIAINFISCLLPYLALKAVDVFVDIFPTVYAEQIGFIIYTALFSLGVTAGILLSVKLIFTEFLYIDNESENIGYYFTGKARRYARKHFKDLLILLFSFIPWILLCFFVLPVFYVLPYITQSLATSAKWLIKLHKDGDNL